MAYGDITDNLTGDPLTTSDPTTTGSTDPVTPPAISLDQADADYAPGETVGITTTNISDGGTFTFEVAHLSAGADGILGTADDVLTYDLTGTGTPWTVTDGGAGDLDGVVNGSIQTSWYVNGDAANQAFMLTATDDLGNTATTTFTDAPKTPPTTFAYVDTHIDITADNTIVDAAGARFSSRDTVIFNHLVSGSSGTGNWSVFAQIQNAGAEQGFNSADGVLDEKTSSQHNMVIALNTLVKVTADGTEDPNGAYYAFRLDMHQTGANPFLSLDQLKIYQSANGSLGAGSFAAGPDTAGTDPNFHFTSGNTTLAYNMNAGGTYSVLMDAEYDSGSGGGGDVIVLVPTANFNPANGNFLYFYSAMGFQGGDWSGTGTFEEWSALSNPAPFSISGTKYEDLTGNGKTADDVAWTHGPVTIFIDDDNSGGFSAGDRTTTTDASGNWSIGGLTLADVGKHIYEQVPAGSQETGILVQTIDNPGSGGTDTGNDFTNFRNFSISGTKYEDLTGDGKTADDVAWSHGPVTIFIDDDNSGGFSAGDRTTTTDASGNWSIGGLTLADVGKHIYEQVPAGSQETGILVQTIGNPGSGGTDTGNDFTNFRNFSISGTKYEDLTGDGKTADDVAWSHGPVTIFIDDDNSGGFSAGDRTTTTDASGNWSIGGLTPADVGKHIYEQVPAGSQETGILVQTIDNPGSGGTDTGNDFTNFRNFSISGTKYEDLTGDGKTADDVAWSHGPVTIFIDDDNSGGFSAGDRTTTTDASGNWSIGGLTLADVGKHIYEQVPAGSQETGILVQTIDNPGSGGTDTGNDFTNFLGFSISGTKYEDLTGDGKTADDVAWTHGPVTIFIDDDNSGGFSAGDRTTTTDASGNWSIDGLAPADVGKHIYEQVPGGSEETGILVQTIDNPGGGGTDTGNDFTNFRDFSISGTKYEDLTGNGKTADDVAWSHGPVTIFIDDDNSGGFSAGDRTTTTDASGNWSIGGLTLADVGKHIYEQVPGGSEETGILVQTIDNPGSGGTDTGNDFTNFRDFSISGTKFEDLTGDGKTADDVAWSHGPVTIFIDDDNSGGFSAGDRTTTTDASGNWSIGGLTLADVGKHIYEQVPGGSEETGILVQTIDNPGSGGTDTGNDFTNFRDFSISGTKYEDLTGDGKTADDVAWSHGPVTIFIDDDNSGGFSAGDRTTTTDASGNWSIDGLTLADVGKHIYEQVPGGSQETGILVQTIDNPGSGGTDTGNDFTNFRDFSISGTKYEDLTGDGKTADDVAWSHGPVTIFIDDDNSGGFSAGDRTTTTDASGNWSIDGLTLADVGKHIYEQVPGGSEETGILVQTIDNPGSGGTDTGNDFTNFRDFSISGTKYEDLTGDGKTADDIPWSHDPVTIYIDVNDNHVFDPGDLSTTTGAGGAWSIGGLTLADVGKSIYEVVPAGSQQTGILVQTVDNPGSGGVDTGNDFTNFLPPPGQGLTPGFWKNHIDILNQELGEFHSGWTSKTSFETIFGFQNLSKIPGTPSIADALGAHGGGVNHLERSSAAAFLSAAVTAVPDGPGGKPELNFSFSAATSPNPAIISILNLIDANHDHTLQPGEVTAAVRDVLNDTGAPTSNFGLTGQPGIEDIANAFDAMNNQTHPDASVFLI